MRIAVVGASPVPFCRGGIENFMAGLCRAINDYSEHSAELIKIPVMENTVWGLIKSYHTFYRTRLDHFDLVITTKYPAWNLRHRNHVIYLGHRLRGLYDTYPIAPDEDSIWKHSPLKFPGPWIKRLVHWLDNRAIRPETISYAYCTSHTIASRHSYFHPDLPPAVVYHSTVREDYRNSTGEHIFTVNRLDAPKRVDLMIQAYRQVKTDVPFLIAGTGPHREVLERLAAGDDRIVFLGDVSEETLLDLYARALGVLYTPYAEDYGLITIEAMKSGKPVITTTDAGGPLEFVKDGINGWIANPDPVSLAAAIEKLLRNNSPDTLADSTRTTVENITWQNCVTEILKPYRFWPLRQPRQPHERRRVTMLTPWPVFPARSGGQRRAAGLCRELAKVYDVTILSLGRFNTPPENIEQSQWLHEIRIPMAPAHARAQWEYEKKIGETVHDAALDRLLPLTPNYIRGLQHFAESSDIIISEQPYMHRHIPESQRLKLVVHSSENFEFRLKESVLQTSAEGKQLLEDTRRAEEAAVQDSHVLFATSQEEGEELTSFYGRQTGRWTLAPNGVDTDEIRPFTTEEREAARKQFAIDSDQMVLLFVGAWHPPNLEALLFISRELAPAFPNACFLIVGSVKDHYGHQVGDPGDLPANMRLLGEVTEAEKNSALAAADIALNPMLSGGGTNLKILEYGAAGLPTIATPVGVRGLELDPGRDVVVADPADFAHSLGQLIGNSELQKTISVNCRENMVKNYDWKSIGRQMIETMEAALPPGGFTRVDMQDSTHFVYGWYGLEKWDDTGAGAGWVRWSTATAQISCAVPRKEAILKLRLHAGQEHQSIKILHGNKPLFEGELVAGWQVIETPFRPVPGEDFAVISFDVTPWSPADTGSADTRLLGIALAAAEIQSR